MREVASFAACFVLSTLVALGSQGSRTEGPPTEPAPPAGMTDPDPFPGACVSCHVDLPEVDARLSKALQQWQTTVPPALLSKAQSTMPTGTSLKGKHPSSSKSLDDVPAACIRCHSASKKAPPFADLMHRIHLTGGEDNHFLTLFEGKCTHCHKLDAETGRWSIPSGPEKAPNEGTVQ